ncbi:MAG TPA: hypothetical protein VIK91_19475 [Nannocystis sp.]
MAGTQDARSRYTPVPVEIAGRRYVLRFTWGPLREVRDRTDGRLDVLQEGIRRAKVEDFPLLLWAGLSHDREGGDLSLTPEAVQAMVDRLDLAEIEALDRAVLQALGVDVDAIREAVAQLRALEAIEEATTSDPLGSPTASGTPTSSSGENPSPSSVSEWTSSGDLHLVSTPPSETPIDGPSTPPTSAPE